MDRDDVTLLHTRNVDPWDRSIAPADLLHIEIHGMEVDRQRGVKLDRQMMNRSTELLTCRPVPTNNAVEVLHQSPRRCFVTQLKQIQTHRRERPEAVGKADQRYDCGRDPHLRIKCGRSEVLKRGQRHNDIADRARSDYEQFQLRISTGTLTSSVRGGRHMRSLHA